MIDVHEIAFAIAASAVATLIAVSAAVAAGYLQAAGWWLS